MNRKFRRSPKPRDRQIKGRHRITRHVGYFAKVRLSLASHKRRLSVKAKAAQLAALRRTHLRLKGKPRRKPRK